MTKGPQGAVSSGQAVQVTASDNAETWEMAGLIWEQFALKFGGMSATPGEWERRLKLWQHEPNQHTYPVIDMAVQAARSVQALLNKHHAAKAP